MNSADILQSFQLSDPLLERVSLAGNSGAVILYGARRIQEGGLSFHNNSRNKKIDVMVTNVVHKQFRDFRNDEFQDALNRKDFFEAHLLGGFMDLSPKDVFTILRFQKI